MTKEYTTEWNGFQFRSPTYLDGHFEPHRFALEKWEDHKPMETADLKTGENKTSTKSCFTVGTLIYDKKEQSFSFESCGLRYLQHRIDGLEGFILNFASKMENVLANDNLLYIYQNHLGGFYTSDRVKTSKELFCPQCGDCDWLLGYASNRDDAWKVLMDEVSDVDDCGYSREYIEQFINENWRQDNEQHRSI